MERKRRKNSGGQALVMVTLALMAMAGLMGLAVDLGWSYFVQKEAQAAADGAALAAAAEAMAKVRVANIAVTALTCGNVANVDCQTTVKPCGQFTGSSSNLANGCLYAKVNGFDYTTASSRQNVTIQSNITSPPPTAPGVNNIVYWVTVRTVQNIPQLFSAVLGNTLGTVSAVATAGIVGSIQPGSFFGMNQAGDCITDPNSKGFPGCGLDIVTGTGGGGMSCPGAPGGLADVCAPSGIIMASSCHAKVTTVLGQCSQAYAGDSRSNSGVYGSSITIMKDSTGVGALNGNNWTPSTPTPSDNPTTFQDPTAPNSQPPLQTTSSSPIGSCGYSGGTISGNVTLGPYQYYSYTTDKSGNKIPDGKPINFSGNVTFSNAESGQCPGGGVFNGGVTQANQFRSTIFWGGLATGNQATFGAGQYIMAGTVTSGGNVFDASNGSGNSPNGSGSIINGDQNTGTMFIFTDGNYHGLTNQISGIPGYANMPTLYQGSLSVKNAQITLYGLVGSSNNSSGLPSAMDAYSGVAWWQDRRNSTVCYNEEPAAEGCNGTDCTHDDGSVIYCNNADCPLSTSTKLANMLSANHVTPSSPGVIFDPGNGNIAVHGVYYQPRGAWLELVHGTTGFSCGASNCPLQVVTGALIEDTGDTGLLLAGPANPLIKYKVSLIQ
jgi:Flp pilus assembly protein TadG